MSDIRGDRPRAFPTPAHRGRHSKLFPRGGPVRSPLPSDSAGALAAVGPGCPSPICRGPKSSRLVQGPSRDEVPEDGTSPRAGSEASRRHRPHGLRFGRTGEDCLWIQKAEVPRGASGRARRRASSEPSPAPRSDPAAQTGANGKNRSSPEAGARPSRNDATDDSGGKRPPSSSPEQLPTTTFAQIL